MQTGEKTIEERGSFLLYPRKTTVLQATEKRKARDSLAWARGGG